MDVLINVCSHLHTLTQIQIHNGRSHRAFGRQLASHPVQQSALHVHVNYWPWCATVYPPCSCALLALKTHSSGGKPLLLQTAAAVLTFNPHAALDQDLRDRNIQDGHQTSDRLQRTLSPGPFYVVLFTPTPWHSVRMLRQQSQSVLRANISDKFLEYCRTLGDTVRSKFQNIRGFDPHQRTDMLVHLRVLVPKSTFLKLAHCQRTWHEISLPSIESPSQTRQEEEMLSSLGRGWGP